MSTDNQSAAAPPSPPPAEPTTAAEATTIQVAANESVPFDMGGYLEMVREDQAPAESHEDKPATPVEDKSKVEAKPTTPAAPAAPTVDPGLLQMAANVGLSEERARQLGEHLPAVVADMQRALGTYGKYLQEQWEKGKPAAEPETAKPVQSKPAFGEPYKLSKVKRETHDEDFVQELESLAAHYQQQLEALAERVKPLDEIAPTVQQMRAIEQQRANQQYFDEFDSALAKLNRPDAFGEGRTVDLPAGNEFKLREQLGFYVEQVKQMHAAAGRRVSLEECFQQASTFLQLPAPPTPPPPSERAQRAAESQRDDRGRFVPLSRSRDSFPQKVLTGDEAALAAIDRYMAHHQHNGRH